MADEYAVPTPMMPSSIEEAFCIVVDKGRQMNDVGKVTRLCDPSTYYKGQFLLSIVCFKTFVTVGLVLILTVHLTMSWNMFYVKFEVSY